VFVVERFASGQQAQRLRHRHRRRRHRALRWWRAGGRRQTQFCPTCGAVVATPHDEAGISL